MKTTKKILGVVLALLMVVSMFPMAAMAATVTVNDLAGLKDALANGGTINLGDDITITGDTVEDRLLVTKTTTINLNGHNIYVDTAGMNNWSAFRVENADATAAFTFTLKGQGTISSATPGEIYGIHVASSYATVNVQDATFTDVLTAVNVNYGTANIKGGIYKCSPAEEYAPEMYRFTLNCIDARYKAGDAAINVTGGLFYNFDPANNLAEGANTNFVTTAGYTTVAIAAGNDTWYSVMKAPTLTYNVADNSVKVSFTKPAGADKFWAYGSTDGEEYAAKCTMTGAYTTASGTIQNGVVADSTYYAKVRVRYAIDGKNYYVDSPVASVATTTASDVTTVAEIKTALNKGQTAVLQNDIDITTIKNSTSVISFTGGGVISTLDLNGKTVNASGFAGTEAFGTIYQYGPIAPAGKTLTITGNGTVNSDKATAVYAGRGEGIIIENGTFNATNAAQCVYAEQGTITILGGTFTVDNDNQTPTERYLLNCLDKNYKAGTANIIVKGGTFKNFNPADCLGEGVGTNYVAEGYTVVSTVDGADTWYTVVPETSVVPTVTLNYVDGKIVATGDTSAFAKAWILTGDKVVGKTAETVIFTAAENFTEAAYTLRVKDNAGNYAEYALEAPAAPVANTVTIASAVADEDSITVTWNAFDNADKYWVYVSTDNFATSKIFAATTGTSYDLTRVADGTTYYFKVTARYTNELGNVSYTDVDATTAASATYEAPAPTFHSEAYFDSFTDMKLHFSFDQIGGDKGWIIVRDNLGNAVKTIAITNTDTVKVVKGVSGVTSYGSYTYDIKVKSGTEYYYAVEGAAIDTLK